MKVKYQEYVYKIMEQFTKIMCNSKVKKKLFLFVNCLFVNHFENYLI